ncbi:MAG: hypothetical protein JWO06_1893 [Bacteroidota bacterium]|nr:hypothetical protein [Bacteroidota bacterium]
MQLLWQKIIGNTFLGYGVLTKAFITRVTATLRRGIAFKSNPPKQAWVVLTNDFRLKGALKRPGFRYGFRLHLGCQSPHLHWYFRHLRICSWRLIKI